MTENDSFYLAPATLKSQSREVVCILCALASLRGIPLVAALREKKKRILR
jgi:hypothetical protein